MKPRPLLLLLIASLVLLTACSTIGTQTGTLKGTVSIGPVTPVQKGGETPPAPVAEMFTSRGIEILKGGQDRVYKTVHFNADGTYSVELPEGNYMVRLLSTDMYLADGLPTSVKITSGQDTVLDIHIDTGIR